MVIIHSVGENTKGRNMAHMWRCPQLKHMAAEPDVLAARLDKQVKNKLDYLGEHTPTCGVVAAQPCNVSHPSALPLCTCR